MLKNRIQKRFKHLCKWAKRLNISAFRVYQNDMTEYPLILDWYDGDAVMWRYPDTADVNEQVLEGLGITPDHLFVKERHVRKEGVQYEKLDHRHLIKTIVEQDLKFEINLTDYVDVGLFLDHRHHRQAIKKMASGKRVLNLFAYTGSFTCYALAGGAIETATVDLSKVYGDWTRRNFALNGFSEGPAHRIFSQDSFDYLKYAAKKKKQFDIIVCDPPTFSRSKKMTGWFAVDEDYPRLLAACEAVLAPGGLLLFSTNSKKFRLNAEKIPNLKAKEKTTPHPSEDFRASIPHRCWYMIKP